MADAGSMHQIEYMRRRIGLDGEQRVARERVEKAARGDAKLVGMQRIDRRDRLQALDQLFDRGKAWQSFGGSNVHFRATPEQVARVSRAGGR